MKAILLIVVWGIYFSMISSKDGTDSGSTELPIRNETAQTIQTTNPPSVFFKESQTPATTITSTPIPTEVSYPIPLYEEGSTKIICWLLDEPVLVSSEMLYNIYTEIDTADPTWQDAAKEVLTFVWNRFGDNQAVIVKLFIDTEDFYKPQTSYQDLIAVWQNNSASNTSQPESEIIWYPNGAGITSDFSSEIWRP